VQLPLAALRQSVTRGAPYAHSLFIYLLPSLRSSLPPLLPPPSLTFAGAVSSTEGTYPFFSPEMCPCESEEGGLPSSSPLINSYVADVWAASVCLWVFVFGVLPFFREDVSDLFDMIR
jgi:hypothetical protein